MLLQAIQLSIGNLFIYGLMPKQFNLKQFNLKQFNLTCHLLALSLNVKQFYSTNRNGPISSGPGSNNNEGLHRISLRSQTEGSPSDCFVSLRGGCSRCILQLRLTVQTFFCYEIIEKTVLFLTIRFNVCHLFENSSIRLIDRLLSGATNQGQR